MIKGLLPLCFVTSTAISVGQGIQPEIPTVNSRTPAFGMEYEVRELLNRSEDDWSRIVKEKEIQYEQMVRDGKITAKYASDFLKDLKSSPRVRARTGTFTIIVEKGRIFVLRRWKNEIASWFIFEKGIAVGRPFNGGGITIEKSEEPYSLGGGQIPIFPLQFASMPSFIDLAFEGERASARMFGASLVSSQYVPATLQFKDGRLSEALLKSIERTEYSDYSTGPVPMPGRIVYESMYENGGTPALTRTFIGKPIVNPVIPKLEKLAPGIQQATDGRGEEQITFTFDLRRSSIFEAAKREKARRMKQAEASKTPHDHIHLRSELDTRWVLGGSFGVGAVLLLVFLLGRRSS